MKIKNISVSLVAVLLVLSVFLSGCFNVRVFINTLMATATFTPTMIPTPTNTSTPTLTAFPTVTTVPTTLPTLDTMQCQYGGGNLNIPLDGLTGQINGYNCGDDWWFYGSKNEQILITVITNGNIQPDTTIWTTATDSCENCGQVNFIGNGVSTLTKATYMFKLPFTGYYVLRVSRFDSTLPTSGSYTLTITIISK